MDIRRVEPEDPASVGRAKYGSSLRVFSTDLNLAELTRRLGRPTRGHDIGDAVSSRRADGPQRKNALWLLQSSLDPHRPLEDHIAGLMTFVEKRRGAFEQLREHCTSDIWGSVFRGDFDAPARPDGIIVFSCGFTLDPELMKRLIALNLTLSVSIA